MKNLFDKTNLKNLNMKNRFIRSATHDGFADKEGRITDKLISLYEKVASGGISTIITGFAFVMESAPSSPGMMGIYNDSFIEGFKKLTDAVHKHDSNIILQMAEGGTQAKWNVSKRKIYAPSAVEHKYTNLIPIEMTCEDIRQHVNAFGDAALRAKKSGFDGVQIHAAHGYLVSQFLTPYYNRRQDEYGGSIENRCRFLMEIYENIRQKTGDDYPIFVKINCSDFMDDEGLSFEDCRYVCKKLAGAGIDLIEVSGNVGFNTTEPEIIRTNINTDPTKQCYFSEYAKIIAEEINVPVAVVGGNRDTKLMDGILNSSKIEYFSLSRTILCENDLINKWSIDADYTPKCLSCNKCFSLKGNVCIFNRATAL